MPVRVDWAKIKSAWPSGETQILCLDTRAKHLLLTIIDSLSWKATYDQQELADTDWDYIQRIVADAEYELGAAMPISELIPYIDDIETLLRNLNTVAQCCDQAGDPTDGAQFTDEVVDGIGDVPQNVIDAGYASSSSDWAGFDDYKCMIAHLVVDSMEAKLRKLAPYVDAAAAVIGGFATIASIVTVIWSGGLTAIALGLIAATGAVSLLYETMISGTALITLADKVQTNHDELACAFYYGDGSVDSVSDLKAKIDELFTTAEEIVLKNTGLEIDSKALYAGRHDQIDVAEKLEALGYELTDFDCTCPLSAGYHWADAMQITYTLEANTFGRINEAVVTLPAIEIGRKVATSAAWGCTGYPCGCATVNAKNTTYQTLAYRVTCLSYDGNAAPKIDNTCMTILKTPGNRYIHFYTLDEAEGIDDDWADANSELWVKDAGGHAKRAIGFNWGFGQTWAMDTSAGADPIRATFKVEHLIWVT